MITNRLDVIYLERFNGREPSWDREGLPCYNCARHKGRQHTKSIARLIHEEKKSSPEPLRVIDPSMQQGSLKL